MSDGLVLLRDRLQAFADARDWPRFHTPRNLALALAGEVGELAAELQWVSDIEVAEHLADPEARARLADEVADVLIYLTRFRTCAVLTFFVRGACKDRPQREQVPAIALGHKWPLAVALQAKR